MSSPIQIALEHHRSGRFAQAESIYRQILSQAPGDPEALHLLGMIAFQTGQNDAAIELINKAVAINPQYAEAFGNLGAVFYSQGRLDESIACSRKAIAINAGHVDAYNNLAIAFLEKGNLDEASTYSRQAIRAKPDSAEGHNNLGFVLFKQDRLDESIRSYQKAIAIRPGYPEALRNLGDALVGQGNFTEAVACYKKAIAARPDYVQAIANLGFALVRLDKGDEALACYRRVIEIEPENDLALHAIAVFTGGNPERAPDQYVINLFDQYAATFDEQLVRQLEYRSPEELVALIRETAAKNEEKWDEKWDVLDLGCGTGLVGAAIAPCARHLVGVDLSGKMLDKAQARNVYTRLENSDLLKMARDEASASYNVVTAADVFIYVGKLDALFAEVKRILRPEGIFGFTIETLEPMTGSEAGQGKLRDYRLTPGGRFAHSSAYLNELVLKYGFALRRSMATVLRLEKGLPVHGSIVILGT